MVKVSVLVPTFNSESTIHKTLAAILAQTENSMEVIVYDDASSDKTCEIIEKEFPQVHLIRGKANQGAGAARKILVYQATGRYVAFCDSDDVWNEKKLELQLATPQIDNALVICDYEIFDEYNKKLGTKRNKARISPRAMLLRNVVPTSGVLLNRRFFLNVEFPKLRKRQDYALWLNLLKANKMEIVNIQKPLFSYMVRKGSLSNNSKVGLLKWNYLMWRHEQKKNVAASVILTAINAAMKVLLR